MRDLDHKREDYISWEDYFMATAFLAARRSKDPSSQVIFSLVKFLVLFPHKTFHFKGWCLYRKRGSQNRRRWLQWLSHRLQRR